MCGFQGILPFTLYIRYIFFVLSFPGDDCEEATPVPIPNTVVKLFHADGTWGLPPWESRSLPGLFFIELQFSGVLFLSGFLEVLVVY